MLAALLIFCVATLVCAVAPSIEALIGARAVQAFGSSGAIVLARAVVRDLYDGPRAGRELSLMAMIMGLAPIVAPVIGSLLQAAFGWRSCFVFIFAAGIVAAAAVRWLLPETLRRRPHQPATGHVGEPRRRRPQPRRARPSGDHRGRLWRLVRLHLGLALRAADGARAHAAGLQPVVCHRELRLHRRHLARRQAGHAPWSRPHHRMGRAGAGGGRARDGAGDRGSRPLRSAASWRP